MTRPSRGRIVAAALAAGLLLAVAACSSSSTSTDAVKSALDAIKAAVSDLSTHPSAKAMTGVVTAVGEVAAAVSCLLAALVPRCGSASPSS